jgi:tRNA nucleotidyltransferase (CCA-adding enzyme)
MPDYMFLLESRLSAEQRAVVLRVVELAQAQGANVYAAGGAVRDLISGMAIRDLDFVVEGNPLRMAREMEKGGARLVEEDETRRHVEIVFHGDVDGSLSAARDDVYDHPGAKPQYRFGTILDDLRRRDFSINAIALSLNPASRGLLLDPTNGLADIERREIRLLSMHGFTNQPGRLLRSLRYAARLGFALEERTSGWFDLAMERKLHLNISSADITDEVRQVGREDNAAGVLKAWEEHDLLNVVHPKFASRKPDYKGLDALVKAREELMSVNRRARLASPTLYYIFGRFSRIERTNALRQLGLRAAEVQGVAALEEQADAAVKLLSGAKMKDARAAYDTIEKLPSETIVFLLTYTRQSKVLSRIKAYLGKWKPMRAALPAAQLELLGIPRGPKFDQVLESFFTLQLHGRVRGPEDYERVLRNLAGIKLEPKKKAKPEKKGKEAPKAAPPAAKGAFAQQAAKRAAAAAAAGAGNKTPAAAPATPVKGAAKTSAQPATKSAAAAPSPKSAPTAKSHPAKPSSKTKKSPRPAHRAAPKKKKKR